MAVSNLYLVSGWFPAIWQAIIGLLLLVAGIVAFVRNL